MPKYLYHYTTIQNLALILKNRTLRLMPLNLMDDLQEVKTKDFPNYGQFVYVSSWTDKKEEVIPMWKMYTKPECGVRIGMIKNPFQIVDNTTNEFRNPTEEEYITSKDNNTRGIYPIIRITKEMKKKCNIYNMGLHQHLEQINYSDNLEELEPKILPSNLNDNESFMKSFFKLGNIKNTYWSFQREWRYVIRTEPYPDLPILTNTPEKQSTREECTLALLKFINGNMQQAFPYFDLHLSDYALETMEIILAPDMPESNKILVECLVEKYNHHALNNIRPSLLTNLIR